ncbi:unnamed protein product [Closterium sp. Yama58-4]|nr:unnamed protein product [Closterium sp. Yama58-4]
MEGRASGAAECIKVGLHLPHALRIGIIPAGSTDCIIMSVTGSRDPTTAALHVVLGHRMPLDVARITTWKEEEQSGKQGAQSDEEKEEERGKAERGGDIAGSGGREDWGAGEAEHAREGFVGGDGRDMAGSETEGAKAKTEEKEEDDEGVEVRYAASFFGYGFYGDVIRRSEGLRWMGPARYDYAGLMTYLHHSSTDLSQLARSSHSLLTLDSSSLDPAQNSHSQSGAATSAPVGVAEQEELLQKGGQSGEGVCAVGGTEKQSEGLRPCWRMVRGKFHSVGAAVMSCRNDKAPDGVAAQAHLADGNLHLILIRKCSRPEYLQ